MANSPYNSYFIQNREKYIQLLDLDIIDYTAWMDDALTPSVNILQLKIITEDLLLKLKAKELTREVLQMELPRLLILSQNLDKIASQNNTYQLIARHSQTALRNAEMKVKTIEDALLASRKEWEESPE